MYKSKLQEYCQAKAWNLPVYATTKEGLDHCPQFKATVVVNGSTFSTPHPSKSSKEAQNQVAKLAYDHLTGSSSGNSDLPVARTSNVVQHLEKNETSPTPSVTGVNSPKRNDKNFKEMEHLYKNQLQIYAQKRSLPLPLYSCKREGPPHACRFRSKVTLEGKTYECPEYFSTVKDAENAAAKVALMALSSDGIQEEDPAVFKNLLQELAQKEYSCFPEYNTTWTGASRMPMFVSTVEINEESFTGEEAKTKKLAEMKAAKVAYTALKERQVKQKSETYSPGSHVKAACHSSSPKLQSTVMAESLQGKSSNLRMSFNEGKGAKQKAIGCEPVKVGLHVAQNSSRQESQCSISGPVQPVSALGPNTNIEPWVQPNNPTSRKLIKVFPYVPNMTFPPGTTVLHQDDKWVAVTRKASPGQ
uniref:DRBM domain-containing protein n=2 Tax=Opuntia streptacantha TaxID=393608 RepID=A0A7C9EYL6_OPUST